MSSSLIDGGSRLNIKFTETPKKMDLDLTKMTACDEPFTRLCPAKLQST
jgi:hypothetical protein